ncbi:MAG: 5-methylthioadenosine/S-adenosylhomocysteine nucleosidase [Thermoleophilia bacterium]|nr:5-methylthioadenosine/S-adenosylhomocysteine nucleosidase [Thermoleophilia bacterium]
MILVVAATPNELRGATGLRGVEVLECGVGPVDAAAVTAARLARSPKPSALLHVGIAGARRETGFEPGFVVIGASATYHDTTNRFVTRELGPDPILLADVHLALPDAPVVAIGTSADVGGTAGCDVEAMEGFGVLRAADLAGIPAIEVRTIANEIEEDDRAKWYFDEALEALAAVLPTLVTACQSVDIDA